MATRLKERTTRATDDLRFEAPDALPATRTAVNGLLGELRAALLSLVAVLGTIWAVQVANWLTFDAFLRFGIQPRTVDGLLGILFAPILHMGAFHIIGNTIALCTVGVMVLLRDVRHFWYVLTTGALLGGLGVWLFGRTANHAGASGVIFALLGYLLAIGIFERRWASVLVSVLAAVFFGTMMLGVLPLNPGVSFESHLFGFLAGVFAARQLARRPNGAPPRALP